MTATARAALPENYLEPETSERPTFESLPGGASPEAVARDRASYQRSLFHEGTGHAKVIPIPTLAPARHSSEPQPIRRVRQRPLPNARRVSEHSQAEFEFNDAQTGAQVASSDVIYCDAPVALPGHRILAAAVDAAMVLIAMGIFMLIFVLGGDLTLSKQTIPFLIAVGAVIALFYRAWWYLANRDSPGMIFAGLRLVDFDGRTPDREQRGMRQIAGLLSLMAAGLGLVWALVDEESLTWHDHISKTFPTPEP